MAELVSVSDEPELLLEEPDVEPLSLDDDDLVLVIGTVTDRVSGVTTTFKVWPFLSTACKVTCRVKVAVAVWGTLTKATTVATLATALLAPETWTLAIEDLAVPTS